jgi:hypothetical protein
MADAFGNAIVNSIISAISPRDELSEVQVTAQRIPVDANGYRLTNNPSNAIYNSPIPKQEIAAADGNEPMPEVVISSPYSPNTSGRRAFQHRTRRSS